MFPNIMFPNVPMISMYPNDLNEHCAKHFVDMANAPMNAQASVRYGVHMSHLIEHLQINKAIPILKKMRVNEAFQVIKTWTNAWATARGYQGRPVAPCFFGCRDREDDLCHYFDCPHMWCRVAECINMPVSRNPCIRFGAMEPTVESLLVVACVFHGYHSIKHIHIDYPAEISERALENLERFGGAVTAVARSLGLPVHLPPALVNVNIAPDTNLARAPSIPLNPLEHVPLALPHCESSNGILRIGDSVADSASHA